MTRHHPATTVKNPRAPHCKSAWHCSCPTTSCQRRSRRRARDKEMTRFRFGKTPAVRQSRISILVLLAGMLIMSASLSAQTPPPIDGVTGTVEPGATLAQEQVAVHAVIAKTVDGVGHLFHYAKALFVHGKKGGDA